VSSGSLTSSILTSPSAGGGAAASVPELKRGVVSSTGGSTGGFDMVQELYSVVAITIIRANPDFRDLELNVQM
jgi:hypothetical protein